MAEVWKKVKDNRTYSVSSTGLVRNDKTGRVLKPWICSVGYLTIKFGLYSKNKLVHRLVATAFISNPDNKPEVNHKDGNKLNNSISNLEWMTRSENIQHGFETGLISRQIGHKKSVGSKNSMAKLNEEKVKQIRKELLKSSSYDIAKKYGVSYATIRYIASGKTWTHVI